MSACASTDPGPSSESTASSSTSGPSSGSASSGSSPGPPADSASARLQQRMQRLRGLHERRAESQRLNHRQVVEEDRRNRQPKNHQIRQQWADRKLHEIEKREAAENEGRDYDREKLLSVSAEEAAKWDRLKRRKQNPSSFSNYEAATARQYDRLVKNIKPDMEAYANQRERMGAEAFYSAGGSIVHGHHKDSQEAIDRLADSVEKQIAKRGKYSRRRVHDDDADIDYINERNMKFNKKLERFYGQYTQEIKQNLERGTAV